MDSSAKKRPTYQDLLDLPDHVTGEILDGELVVSPRPAPKQANAHTGLAGRLRLNYQSGEGGPGGWWIFAEPEVHLGSDVLVPDIAGWKKSRLPKHPFSNSPQIGFAK